MPLPYGGMAVDVERAVYDRFNDATYTFSHTLFGCLEFPVESTEEANSVTDRRRLLAPSGSDVRATDRIKIRGLAYQVNGLPKDWIDPLTGWAPGMQVDLVRVT